MGKHSRPAEKIECWMRSSFGHDFCGVHPSQDWPCKHATLKPPPAVSNWQQMDDPYRRRKS